MSLLQSNATSLNNSNINMAQEEVVDMDINSVGS